MPTVPEIELPKSEETIFQACLSKGGEKWPTQCWPKPFHSQLNKTAPMCCHPSGDIHTPPPLPSFLLPQNLYTMHIVPGVHKTYNGFSVTGPGENDFVWSGWFMMYPKRNLGHATLIINCYIFHSESRAHWYVNNKYLKIISTISRKVQWHKKTTLSENT